MQSILDCCHINIGHQNAPNNTGDFGSNDLAISPQFYTINPLN